MKNKMKKGLANLIASIGLVGTMIGSAGMAYHLINREIYRGIEFTYSSDSPQLEKIKKEIQYHHNCGVCFGAGAFMSLGLTATGSFKDKEEEEVEQE